MCAGPEFAHTACGFENWMDVTMRCFWSALASAVLAAGCSKDPPKAEARPPVEVTVTKVAPRDAPVTYEYVGQTQSSHQVQIRARVAGFLDKRLYTEGTMVRAGQPMFQQDPKPFQAQLDAAKGALAEQQARLQTANEPILATLKACLSGPWLVGDLRRPTHVRAYYPDA
jgi:multidrug efflux pump subunit AcrA (membrane-fusion protein)